MFIIWKRLTAVSSIILSSISNSIHNESAFILNYISFEDLGVSIKKSKQTFKTLTSALSNKDR